MADTLAPCRDKSAGAGGSRHGHCPDDGRYSRCWDHLARKNPQCWCRRAVDGLLIDGTVSGKGGEKTKGHCLQLLL